MALGILKESDSEVRSENVISKGEETYLCCVHHFEEVLRQVNLSDVAFPQTGTQVFGPRRKP